MQACCAAMARRLGELMGSASKQEPDVRQDGKNPNDAAHNTNFVLHLELVDGLRSAGHHANHPTEQRNGSVSSDSDALGTESTRFRVMLQKIFPHAWRRRDTADKQRGRGKWRTANIRAVTSYQMQSSWESCFAICQIPLCASSCF